MPEEFKRTHDILTVDERSCFPYAAPADPAATAVALQRFHESIEQFHLADGAPADVQDVFIAAKHVALYSWFAFPLRHVAQLQAFGALELALKDRLNYSDDDRKTLRPLMEEAVAKGIFDPVRLSAAVPPRGSLPRMTAEEWLATLPAGLADLRNSLAHGSADLWPDFWSQFALVVAMINQVYERAA